jgi:DeoR/GlpR family transcriptional regulator of sugar metabolism
MNVSRQRRELIRDRVIETGSVRIDALAREFGVTVMTIHRDLNALEADGWVRKVRGGATIRAAALIDTTVQHRLVDMVEAKSAIAHQALNHVESGQALLLDDSTTVLRLAQLLPGHGPLTVITNFLMAINALSGKEDLELIGLGGTYTAAHDAFLGLATCDAIAKLRADVLFMSTTALGGGGLFHKSQETIQVRQAMMRAAARRVLLVDHQKFHRRATHHLAQVTDFDLVIVDDGIDPAELAALRDAGVAVEVAPLS